MKLERKLNLTAFVVSDVTNMFVHRLSIPVYN